MCQIFNGKSCAEELRWVARLESGEGRREAARESALRQEERAWQIWTRVALGGERRVDIAREFGYKDGSAITQILKRLAISSHSTPKIVARMDVLKAQHAKALSRIKS